MYIIYSIIYLTFISFVLCYSLQKGNKNTMLWIIYSRGEKPFNATSIRMSCAAHTQGLNFKKIYSQDCEIINDKLYINGVETNDLPDIVFARCYAYHILDYLDAKGVKIINKLSASKRARSKWETYNHVAKLSDILQPKTLLESDYSYAQIVEHLGLPFVMKNNFGSLGKRCYLVKNKYQFSAIKRHNREVEFIVQKYLSTSHGKDIRVYVIGDKIEGAVMRKAVGDDFRANISLGGTFEPLEIDEALKNLSLKLAKHCELDICGLDFLFGPDGYEFCEINSNAGFTAFSKQGIMIRDDMMIYLREKYKDLIYK